MGERLLFFPSVGFCLVIGLLIEKITGVGEANLSFLKNKKVLAIIIPIVIIFLVLTIYRNSEWIDNYTLYTADIKKAPQSVKLNFWLGLELLAVIAKEEKDITKQKQIKEEGIEYIDKSLAIYPYFSDAESELSAEYFREGKYDSAEIHGNRAISINPENPVTLNNLGSVNFIKKDYEKAIALYKNAIRIKPEYVDPYTNAATSFLSMGKVDSGIYYLYEAVAVDPTYNLSYVYLGMAYKSIGKVDSERKYEAIAERHKK